MSLNNPDILRIARELYIDNYYKSDPRGGVPPSSFIKDATTLYEECKSKIERSKYNGKPPYDELTRIIQNSINELYEDVNQGYIYKNSNIHELLEELFLSHSHSHTYSPSHTKVKGLEEKEEMPCKLRIVWDRLMKFMNNE